MDDDFTFAVVPPLAGGGIFPGGRRIGPPYPVFGRPRSPPRWRPPEQGTATARVPFGRLLLVDRGLSSAQPLDDHHSLDLDGETVGTYYCSSWCPGWPVAASPARCQKSGSTGSVLRWRQRLNGRSHSDGKEKFVFLNTSSSEHKGRSGAEGGIGGHAWSYYAKGGKGGGKGGGNGGRRRSFLPYKQDLVGLFANATAFRRSYHPF